MHLLLKLAGLLLLTLVESCADGSSDESAASAGNSGSASKPSSGGSAGKPDAGSGGSTSGGSGTAAGGLGGAGSAAGGEGDASAGADGGVAGSADAEADASGGGDGSCGAHMKRCGGLCVTPSPALGCSLADCAACPTPPTNAQSTCSGDACEFECWGGYQKAGESCVWGGTGGVGGTGGIDAGPPVTCSNGIKDGQETDVDCGGKLCDKCDPDQTCNGNADCASGICRWNGQKTVCVDPGWCNNGTKDFIETDVDCGGNICAARCVPNKTCGGNADCGSSICRWNGQKSVCVDPAWCNNGTKDFIETDVDCGGNICIARCVPNRTCGGDADCGSSICRWNGQKSVCVDPGWCNNGTKDFIETDVDCGGNICTDRCQPNQTCGGGPDCGSGLCRWNGQKTVCVDPGWCNNGTKDFTETDVDCGGDICVLRCAVGQRCGAGPDCVSGSCQWNGSQTVCQ